MIIERKIQTRMFVAGSLEELTGLVNSWIAGRTALVDYWNFDNEPKSFCACVHITDYVDDGIGPMGLNDDGIPTCQTAGTLRP